MNYAAAWLLPVLLGVQFVVTGARATRLVRAGSAGARAGAVAGFVIAAIFVTTFAIMDNLFYETIIQQPGKIGSTRASLHAALLPTAIFFLSVTGIVGAVLGAARRPDRRKPHRSGRRSPGRLAAAGCGAEEVLGAGLLGYS